VLVLERNPNYGGRRPSHLREIDVAPGPPQPQAIAKVKAGGLDAVALTTNDGGPAARARLLAAYGPLSAAARAGRQRYFSGPTQGLLYLVLNTRRAPFSSARIRRAVNHAIDRRAIGGAANSTSSFSRPTDQYIPPGLRGFRDAAIYPLGGPDVAAARRLAGHRSRHAVLYTCESPRCRRTAALVRRDLHAIGIAVDIRQFSYEALYERLARSGEPWDIGDIGWVADDGDPEDILQPLFGAVGPGNPLGFGPRTRVGVPASVNLGRFADPAFERRLRAADRLPPSRRYRAFGRLDAELARRDAPVVAYGTNTNEYFFSARMGCELVHPVYGIDLAALCRRR
jgi:ABC-type oligopeptide transport system substrate-binding subunit